MKKTTLLGLGLAALIGCTQANDTTELKAFPTGYEFKSIQLPTRGEVTHIAMLENFDYETIVAPDSSIIEYSGEFFYRIKPEKSLDVNYQNPDFPVAHANDPWWEDIRPGTVVLERKTKK